MAATTIVGAGLAGTTLAWVLVRRGRTVRLIDREPPTTTSRVAAGLLTPITGKKPAVSWRWAELRPAAERFYRQVEEATGVGFFHPRPVHRLFTSEQEREAFRKTDFAGLIEPAGDGVLMPSAAQLDVAGYLDVSREYFRHRGMYDRSEWVGTTGEMTILCQGYTPCERFALPFRAAKGEVLTVRVSGIDAGRVLNRGGWWLAPTSLSPLEGEGGRRPGEGFLSAAFHPTPVALAPLGAVTSPQRGEVFRFGATYSWDRLDSVPTPEGRAELEAKFREMIPEPFEVVGHAAGVRPIVAGRTPLIGMHPTIPNLGVFNGLGSKGSLTAPFFAEMFASHLCDGTPIEQDVDVRRR
jgi:glycine/D-amino acid oxidase-like deaminating enzyme